MPPSRGSWRSPSTASPCCSTPGCIPGRPASLVPFTMGYRPLFSGLGVVAAYLAALLGLSFYARRRIGVRLWRRAHRATVLVYLLGVVHALGAGTDASTPWLRAFLLTTGAPIVVLFLRRLRGRRPIIGAADEASHNRSRRHPPGAVSRVSSRRRACRWRVPAPAGGQRRAEGGSGAGRGLHAQRPHPPARRARGGRGARSPRGGRRA